MTRTFLGTVAALSLLHAPAIAADKPASNSVTAMSFNILKPIWQKRGQPGWGARRTNVYQVIREVDPDFVGTQEEANRQVKDILTELPAYREIGHRGQSGAIFYRHARWKLVKAGRTDFPRFPRYFIWGLFEEKGTGKKVYFYTTHIPWLGQMNAARRMGAARMIVEHAAKREHKLAPVILTGDFNSTTETPPMKYLVGQEGSPPIKFTYAHQDKPYKGPKLKSFGIDHVLTHPEMKTLKSGVARGVWDSGSDHPAVFAMLKF